MYPKTGKPESGKYIVDKQAQKMVTSSVISWSHDDYADHEQLVYRKLKPIYNQAWINIVLSTLRFILESAPFAWAALTNWNADYGSMTAYAIAAKNDTTGTHSLGSDWKIWLFWSTMWMALSMIWLISVVQVVVLIKIQQWRPGTGKAKFREIIVSLTAEYRSLEGIVAMNCIGLILAMVWSILTWKEYLNGYPTAPRLDVDPIIGLLITPWTVLAVAIIFNAYSFCSKTSRLTKTR